MSFCNSKHTADTDPIHGTDCLLQFCELISQQIDEISPCTIIAFIEFLGRNGLLHVSISLSALKTVFKLYQFPTHILHHEWVQLTEEYCS